MATYRVQIRRKAHKELATLPKDVQRRIGAAIDKLAENPFARESTKLKGSESARKVRVGAYRIVYEAIADQLLVYVIRIRHRKEVYERLK